MTPYLEIFLKKESVFLLPQKAIFRPLYKQLILGDIHLGKATHFRKQGIPMPAQSHLKDIDLIHHLINSWNIETVMILGDLFHSEYNREWLWFQSLLMAYPKVQFILVEGNHDILPLASYEIQNLIKLSHIEEMDLIFSHHPLVNPKKLNICGHVHPGIKVHGNARQSVKLPCFYKSSTHLILPAFGDLTGLKLLEHEENSEYYLITGNRVLKL